MCSLVHLDTRTQWISGPTSVDRPWRGARRCGEQDGRMNRAITVIVTMCRTHLMRCQWIPVHLRAADERRRVDRTFAYVRRVYNPDYNDSTVFVSYKPSSLSRCSPTTRHAAVDCRAVPPSDATFAYAHVLPCAPWPWYFFHRSAWNHWDEDVFYSMNKRSNAGK